MVDLLSRCDHLLLPATFTQWVGSDEAGTYVLPRPAVPFLHGRITMITLVIPSLLLGMLLTKAAVDQPGTAGVGAWTLRFTGHTPTFHA